MTALRQRQGHILSPELAESYARATLANVVREYPCKLDHVISGPGDLESPRELHPLFYGSFDWHSAVHGYWQLVRLRRMFPDAPLAEAVRSHMHGHFTAGNVGAEIDYFNRPTSRAFERPYGWAWLLKLAAELRLCTDAPAAGWQAILNPLSQLVADRFKDFIARLKYPCRAGTHGNSAFAIAFAHDYAVVHEDAAFQRVLEQTARRWYGGDRQAQAWEPSHDDFFSPTLIEAECMRRVLPADEFPGWFADFLPDLAGGEPHTLLLPAEVPDRTDQKLVHLDGLNLTRAWCWRGIIDHARLDQQSTRRLNEAVEVHLGRSLAHVHVHYAGAHWLATFAVLAFSG